MLIFNYIVNSKIINFLPYKLVKYFFTRLIYYRKSPNKKYHDNYINSYLTDSIFLETFNKSKKIHNKFDLNKKYQIIIILISIFYRNKRVIFLDFGSGNIENFFYLKSKLKYLKYIYFDKVQNNIFYQKKKEKFNIKDFEIFKNQYTDLVYFGSTLQYIDELKNLDDINLEKAKFICITNTPLISDSNLKSNKIFITQRNMNNPINCIFYKKKYLLDFFKKKNFVIYYEGINTTDPHINFNDIKYKCEIFDIILKKI
jgi:hypothetical protein